MKGFEPLQVFGENVGHTPMTTAFRGDEEAAASFLSALAQGRPALEFAIGTGRIAIPLAEKGVQVDGIELSPHMVERLRAKIRNNPINVTIGDMSTTTTNQRYGLVSVATTQFSIYLRLTTKYVAFKMRLITSLLMDTL